MKKQKVAVPQTLRICSFAAMLLGLPAAVHAWNWGALWTVYDGVWGHEQSYNSYYDVGGKGPDTHAPVAVLAASSGGQVQAMSQGHMLVTTVFDQAHQSCTFDSNSGAQSCTTPSYPSISYQSPVVRGNQVNVAPGTAVSIEWSCLNSINYQGATECSKFGCNMGHTGGGTYTYPVFASTGGNGFATGGALYGTATVNPQQTTTYTLQCAGASISLGYWCNPITDNIGQIIGQDCGYASTWYPSQTSTHIMPDYYPNAILSVTVGINDPCPTAVSGGWNGGWLLYPGGPRRFNAGGHNVCLTNNSGQYLFIGRSQGEIDSFFGALGRLGVSQQ